MIYTLTLNPAIDCIVHTPKLQAGKINSLDGESVFFGGKGINVSAVLKELDVPSVALGFIGGFTGDALETAVRLSGIETDFVRLEEGLTRINVKIRAENETDLNAKGPKISNTDVSELFKRTDRLKDGDFLVMAGSVPPALSPDIYEQILERLSGKNIKTAVDARKDLLLNTLKHKPFLIKPNDEELEEIFGIRFENARDISYYADRLRQNGAQNVLVSMGEKGAVLLDSKGSAHRTAACKGKAVNTVGAGDSMVAGFIAGYEKSGGDYEYALKLGAAAGASTAFSEGLGTREQILELFGRLQNENR